MEFYLKGIIKDTTMKRKDYGTLASSEMHTETLDEIVILPCSAVLLRHFEKKKTTRKVHDLIAIPFFRTELQLRLIWCIAGLTMGEYGSEERKRSK